MNKYKKIAMSAVAVVMAGTMVIPFAACKRPKRTDPVDIKTGWDTERTDIDAAYKPKTKEVGDGKQLTYTRDSITITTNVGNRNTSLGKMGIKFTGDELSGEVKMPDGKTYASGSLKPAWAALSKQLGVSFDDQFANDSSDNQIKNSITDANDGKYDIITGSLTVINTNTSYFLDLNDYVYYMPNYKAFLESNMVTVFSLTGNENGGMYAAPYFDGNNDIEKYDMVRRDWVRTLLDGTDISGATTTFAEQATGKKVAHITSNKSSAKSFMGTKGKWTVPTTNPGDTSKTLTLTVDYDAALAAAKNGPLADAITDAAGKAYDGESGNIIDLQNFAIDAKAGAVTGAQLTTILREYIKVAYKDGSKAFYNGQKYGEVTTKVSDVFNSSWAAWDVDLLTAMMRSVVTGINLFDDATKTNGVEYLYGLTGRQNTTQRTVDLHALAGELYGVRGMESRFEYTYFDEEGNLRDNRQDTDSYDMLAKMGDMAKEGLLYVCNTGSRSPASGKTTYANNDSIQAFMLHDYVQTQTKPQIDGTKLPAGYDFAPIVTPVSNWDTNSDGTKDTIMRFTESWRATKNTGFAVSKKAVANNPEKLSAVLALIDYMFSPDGQILMTYGPQSTTGNTNPDGWWYATESSRSLNSVIDSAKTIPETDYAPAQYVLKDDANLKKEVFLYQGKVWEGNKDYTRNIPQLTDANKELYLHMTVDGVLASGIGYRGVLGNNTDYARRTLGTTLPIGNKDQGFEFQCTAPCGLDGSATVNTALENGTIQHVKLSINKGESFWYLSVPTIVPYNASQSTTLNSDAQSTLGKYFLNNSSVTGDNSYTNVYTDLLFYGYNSTMDICGKEGYGKMKTSAEAYISWLGTPLSTRASINSEAWDSLDRLYELTDRELSIID